MILVDARVGSRELIQSIRRLGVEAELAGKIEADFQFMGNGEYGSVLVGVERKTIQDLANSMRDRRLAGGQIGRMLATYDVSYLVVEGIWRRGRETGLVETRNGQWGPVRGRFQYAEVDRFLTSLEELGSVRLWRTQDEEETAAAIVNRFSWWQKEWEEHRTAHSVYAPILKNRGESRPGMFRQSTTLLEAWLAQLPRIDSRAPELAEYFSSPLDMATAEIGRWMAIHGIGRTTAEGIVRSICGDPQQPRKVTHNTKKDVESA